MQCQPKGSEADRHRAPRGATADAVITAADLNGHWRRDWIKGPGFEDHTTRVHWFQSGDLCADIRVPVNRPDIRGAQCLADLPPRTLARLMRAEGFAGTIDVRDSVCTWTRTINWHGFPAATDAGRLSRGTEGRLIEDGVHATYRERWQRQPADPFETLVHSDGTRTTIVLHNGARFLLASGDEDAPAVADLMATLASGTAQSAATEAAFASVYALGRWYGTSGVADLSTNPFEQRQRILTRTPRGLVWERTRFDGSPAHMRLPFQSPPRYLELSA